jgi:hypothetical protein
MKSRLIAKLVSALFLPLALHAVIPSAAAVERPVKLLGDPAPASSGTRNIVITPDTKHVNVTGGEVINFIVGNKIFTWSFFVGEGISSFDLNQIAPPGMLDHVVTAYIARDPRYMGGNNNRSR